MLLARSERTFAKLIPALLGVEQRLLEGRHVAFQLSNGRTCFKSNTSICAFLLRSPPIIGENSKVVGGTDPPDKTPKHAGVPMPVVPEPSPADGIPRFAKGTEDHLGSTRKFRSRSRTDDSASMIRSNVNVLAIVGDPDAYAPVLEWIHLRGIEVEFASSATDGMKILEEKGTDLVLLGLPLPDALAAATIDSIRQRDARATIVIVGKDEDVSSQIAANELGAQEYVADPAEARRDLLFALGVLLGVRRSDAHFRVLRGREAAAAQWRRIVAGSPVMADVMKRLRELCEWTLTGATPTVLVTGAHGTGKRTLARALHYNGARRNRAFVEINCASLRPEQLRTELFGEIHGAARQGLLEIADGGTVFLDEIDAVPLGIQRELLTAIEGRQIWRVGSVEPIIVDVQFVAATRVDLGEIVKRSEFRPDLYHRLSVRTLALPPLRERGGDILPIAEALIADLATAYSVRAPSLHEDAALALLGHAWPGNIDELRNELEHVMVNLDGTTIRAEHFRFRRNIASVVTDGSEAHFDVFMAGDRCPLDRLEREVIRQALARNDGNISRTARFLAITRQTLLYRLKKHGLRVPSDGD